MMKNYTRLPLLPLLLLSSACTQDQAPIKNLGTQYYGRDSAGLSNHDSYSSYNVDSHAVQAASVSSVGTSDLPPAGQQPAGNNTVYNSQPAPVAVTDTTPNDPFTTPPSKPLEQPAPAAPAAQPGQLTQQDKATLPTVDTTYPEASGPAVYTKDGISLIWPINGGKIIAHFKGEANDGINIAMSEGEPIMAAASGTVVYSGNDLKDYGNMIVLRHDNGWLTAYANASRIVAKKGAYVKQGDIIAYVGSSGNVKTPQLHFALRKGKAPVDPEQYLPRNGAK